MNLKWAVVAITAERFCVGVLTDVYNTTRKQITDQYLDAVDKASPWTKAGLDVPVGLHPLIDKFKEAEKYRMG